MLNTFGIQTTSLVAVIGAAGLAVGLALQGTLSNVAAGVMLIFFRPIKIGDFVEINGESGTVKAINLNFTELASIGNVQIIIPNSEVWGNTITNYSAYDTRQAEWTFGVGYAADLDLEKVYPRHDQRRSALPGRTGPPHGGRAELVQRRFHGPRLGAAPRILRLLEGHEPRGQAGAGRAGVEIPFPNRTVHIVSPD